MSINIEFINRVKEITLIALYSDDDLMDNLVFKGGNALSLIYKISDRPSLDLDFSISGTFSDLQEIEKKIFRVITKAFKAEKYVVFDLKLLEKPENVSNDIAPFWRGYHVEFKIIDEELFEKFNGDEKKFGNMQRL